MTTALHREIVAYERLRPDLEARHRGKWAVVYSGDLVGVYPEFEEAAAEAVERFDNGPYLIRQIGVEKIQVSSTMMFWPSHA